MEEKHIYFVVSSQPSWVFTGSIPLSDFLTMLKKPHRLLSSENNVSEVGVSVRRNEKIRWRNEDPYYT